MMMAQARRDRVEAGGDEIRRLQVEFAGDPLGTGGRRVGQQVGVRIAL